MAPVITAHASLACFRKFENTENMQTWTNGIFKKVVCVVSETEFINAKKEPDNVVLTESAMNNQEVCIAFSPRKNIPRCLNFLACGHPETPREHA